MLVSFCCALLDCNQNDLEVCSETLHQKFFKEPCIVSPVLLQFMQCSLQDLPLSEFIRVTLPPTVWIFGTTQLQRNNGLVLSESMFPGVEQEDKQDLGKVDLL